MSATERFAQAADAFRLWAMEGSDGGSAAARAALVHLAELFAAALVLPHANVKASSGVDVSDDEWRAVFVASRRLPVHWYRVPFDPLLFPAAETGLGDIADDLADVYRDVVTGLRAFAAGDTAGAIWQWRFMFWAHWGRHAIGAMSALRAWVEAEGEGY